MGKLFMDHYICPNKFEFDEGKESDEFWNVLGGKQ